MYYFGNRKKEKEYKQVDKTSSWTNHFKVKRLDGTILMDLGNWYTIRESFKAQWKEPKK
jgi:exonuclease SbcC